MTNPVFCALDMPDPAEAATMALQVAGHVGGIKLGLEFFMAQGPGGIAKARPPGLPFFLDVKLHDIPNTVAGALKSLLPLKADFITIHASGGAAMMRAARDAAAQAPGARPKLLGVTALTSLDGGDLAAVGQDRDVTAQVVRLAKLAQDSGLDGVICAPTEISALRAACGKDFILMVPGIRPSWAAAGDQKRVMTPREAMAAGATYLVIGRPITAAPDPADAARKIAEELAG
ncbi:MAG: orotidine-5'-phosphate decarboxylase [Alphaproteobacteria bacterium]